jgi:hypothetical protein
MVFMETNMPQDTSQLVVRRFIILARPCDNLSSNFMHARGP